ncbi:dephospho-CoA kinase [Cryobacterium tagatosivorans]|uniref:Dephospho-CoA kinase n=1 Tax=Cryobacterium tagatosivorans TaxID=1259199 RepID=A0A4R8UK89_9MICO|nr:dephospho-CoA kinase [Cryobacterium tagatosivorans]TFB55645.1 dephospho-CoA kinase [Cryobacterium tagatosivorans]
MYVIGLTGGIASGKSTVARRLVEHGAVHIDADHLARVVVEPGTDALARIRETFGDEVLNADGSLNRAALGALVFGEPAALAQLNAIVHPAVRALSDELIRAAEQADPDAIVVYDVPLLVEADVAHPFDLIVVAHADEETRMRRMVDLRGMDETDAARRIGSQASAADRLAIANVVIDTDGTLAHTLAQVDALYERVRAELGRSTVRGAP